jgi:hypothetical protein
MHMSGRNDTMRRARRLLRSLESAKVARRRLMGDQTGEVAETSELDALHRTIHAQLAALQRQSRFASASVMGNDDLARLLARAEQTLGGA